MTRVAVIGGGIAGLSAAWEARRRGADVTVYEAGARAGGVVVTERREGCLIEGGPDGFLDGRPDIPRLCEELGIEGELVGQSARDALLFDGAGLSRLPPGRAAQMLELAVGDEEAGRGFVTLRSGMGALVDALASALGDSVRLRSPVTSLREVAADAIIVAVPAHAAASLLNEVDPELPVLLDQLHSASTATVTLAYDRAAVPALSGASGFVVRRETAHAITACTFVSSKFPGRAPADVALLRAHVGRFGSAGVLELPDAVLVGAVEQDLDRILEVGRRARWSRVFRWPLALPRITPEREGRLAAIHQRAAGHGLKLVGAAFGGVGLSACVREARAAGAVVAAGTLVA